MLQTTNKIEGKHYVAFSGGVDSVAAAHRLQRYLDIELIFIHHETDNSELAMNETVVPFSGKFNLKLNIHHIDTNIKKNESLENHWRNERYKVFHEYDGPVVTCHHLNDCVETWVWSAMHGNPRVIPYRNRNVIRPFLPLRKERFIQYANHHDLTWTEDSSNMNTKFTRNFIRHKMMDNVLKVNPGIYKTIRKKVLYETDQRPNNTI